MEKEEYRKAFKAGIEYWSWVQTDEPLMHKPIDFDEWYDTVVLPQANVSGNEVAVCDVCGSDDVIEAPHMGRNCNRCHPL
jgi:hypothetical protein